MTDRTEPRDKVRGPEFVVFGAAVREMRARRGVSQEELAHRANNMHRNYVGALERGEINPTFRTLLSLAHGLETNLSTLIRLYERRRTEHDQPEAGPC